MEHLTFHSLYIIHYSTPSYNQECKEMRAELLRKVKKTNIIELYESQKEKIYF